MILEYLHKSTQVFQAKVGPSCGPQLNCLSFRLRFYDGFLRKIFSDNVSVLEIQPKREYYRILVSFQARPHKTAMSYATGWQDF